MVRVTHLEHRELELRCVGLWRTHGALGVRRRLMSFGEQKPAREVESPDPGGLRTFTILLTLVSSLVERPQSVRDRQALAQWCTLMLLPIGIAIFSAKGFLSLGWASFASHFALSSRQSDTPASGRPPDPAKDCSKKP